MFLLTIVIRSLRRQWRKRLLIALTVALSTAVSLAMLGIVFDVQDKLSEELAAYGSNIVVRPKSQAVVNELYETVDSGDNAGNAAELLDEEDARNIKSIFWAYNITNFAPRLDVKADVAVAGSSATAERVPVVGTWFANAMHLDSGESTVAGISGMRSWWTVQGRWPKDGSREAVVGAKLAQRLGIRPQSLTGGSADSLVLQGASGKVRVTVVGVTTSGDKDDQALATTTAVAQELAGTAGTVSSIEVKALTTPDNELARRASKNPAMLSQEEWETWYCTAYGSSIAYQIEEAIPGAVARQVRQVSAVQADVLNKTRAVMIVMTALSLVAAVVAVSNLMAAAIRERSTELALLKAVGAGNGAVCRLLLAETAVVFLGGLVVGGVVGAAAAYMVGQAVFGTSVALRPLVLLLVAVLMATSVLMASLASIRSIISLQPAQVLHGR